MEFLLINHPLDCPICDQGGECELQDLAMGFGRDVSRFSERKRVVKDKNIGPLVSTDMTRCIHCTRCVRFGQEIAGIQELGTIGRGERMQISTFVERSVDHELSGNIIDLCPVGALNSKPYRFSARAWEMQALPTVAPHDCVGSNLSAHVLLGKVKRVVPRANEAVNETWLSDRDRFSYEGIYAGRVEQPMIRDGGALRPASWEEALEAAAAGIARCRRATVAPALAPGLRRPRRWRRASSCSGCSGTWGRTISITGCAAGISACRSGIRCSRGSGLSLAELEQADAIVVVGSNLRREAPLIAHRVRKAALRGASVVFVNPGRYEYLHPVAGYLETGLDLVGGLRRLLVRQPRCGSVRDPGPAARRRRGRWSCWGRLPAGTRGWRTSVRRRANWPASTRPGSATFPRAPTRPGCPWPACCRTGVPVAHRWPGQGRNLAEMQDQPLAGLLLLNVEPEHDCADGRRAVAALEAAGFVLALSPYLSPALEAHADVVLPVGTFAETAGTFVNCEGRWQSFNGVAAPVGASRPAWKVLRVLGNLLQVPDFDYESAEDVRAVVHGLAGAVQPDNTVAVTAIPPAATAADDRRRRPGRAHVPDRRHPAPCRGPPADA